ncbi:MAG: molybdopterin biosynthesis protein [Actinomycetia bacterium]|nr:molybdopterin biosynthesis protein [Actinomycetes bacterium]
MKQHQFLDVVDEAVAHERFDDACIHLGPRSESVSLDDALGRVLSADVTARVDVPGFDRSNVDGFAVRAANTSGATELDPVVLGVSAIVLAAGQPPPERFEVPPETGVSIATGAVVPRRADAVVMVEDTELDGSGILVSRGAVPGDNISFAGSDIGRGEVVLRRGTRLSARETGVLAAVGVADVDVVRRPRVAVISTGDEIVSPGSPIELGGVFDSNQRVLLDSVVELGCEPIACGIIPDDETQLEALLLTLVSGSDAVDVVILSGGTSKGEGDINARVVDRLADRHPESPGVVVHGVALKPGKPVLLSVIGGVPLIVLPGFPTSAIFTFHEFVAPLLRRLSGQRAESARAIDAVAPMRINSVSGRTEYSLVDLVQGPSGFAAYPLGAGSGSVTAFGRADGFIRIPANTEYVAEGTQLSVILIDPLENPADLIAIGSHCVGFDHVLGLVAEQGFRVKSIPVGSTAGIGALERGEGDVAGVHLLDEETGDYNKTFVSGDIRLVTGYGRRQGIAFRRDDTLFDVESLDEMIDVLLGSKRCMINRNPGSGTRILIDGLLRGSQPDGYLHQARTHHGVAAAIEQRRADWGMTLDTVAAVAGLGFFLVAEEKYDVAIREDRWDRPAVAALRNLLEDSSVRSDLASLGFEA